MLTFDRLRIVDCAFNTNRLYHQLYLGPDLLSISLFEYLYVEKL